MLVRSSDDSRDPVLMPDFCAAILDGGGSPRPGHATRAGRIGWRYCLLIGRGAVLPCFAVYHRSEALKP